MKKLSFLLVIIVLVLEGCSASSVQPKKEEMKTTTNFTKKQKPKVTTPQSVIGSSANPNRLLTASKKIDPDMVGVNISEGYLEFYEYEGKGHDYYKQPAWTLHRYMAESNLPLLNAIRNNPNFKGVSIRIYANFNHDYTIESTTTYSKKALQQVNTASQTTSIKKVLTFWGKADYSLMDPFMYRNDLKYYSSVRNVKDVFFHDHKVDHYNSIQPTTFGTFLLQGTVSGKIDPVYNWGATGAIDRDQILRDHANMVSY
ncbi:MAG: hypothetical protein ABF651_07665 [Sporolactobacillus sp.]